MENVEWLSARQEFHLFTDLVKEFENSLPVRFVVGAVVDGVIFTLERLSLTKTGYIIFYGHLLDGSPFQHIRSSKAPVLSLIGLPRPEDDADQTRRPIGFEIQES